MLLLGSLLALAACGGGGGDAEEPATAAALSPDATDGVDREEAQAATSTLDAHRLATQASFGATPALVSSIRKQGPAAWIAAQMALPASHYTLGKGDAIHRNTSQTDFCSLPQYKGANCWRDWYSTQPLLWDFYRHAVKGEDQLRQRVAFALQQILVVSSVPMSGTYGFRRYHNTLNDGAFGNYKTLLRKVTLSPLMGDYLNSVNNDADAPNENYARELLQLFSVGTCLLNSDGTLKKGRCVPTYDNAMVRAYAYALTGWTYPAGGATSWGCWPRGTNCRHWGADMVAWPEGHNSKARTLLSGVKLGGGHTPAEALDAVIDSLIVHPNTAPFVGKQLIQHLVTGNPSPAYVARVAAAFRGGRYEAGGKRFGTGKRGDLAATVAAVLLDAEARDATPAETSGKLKEPVLMVTGVLRALNGKTDGDALGWYWGERLRQHVFRAPTVFNFYPPNYPLPGSDRLSGPEFGIHDATTALLRLNFLTYLLMWDGSDPESSVPGAVGTKVDLSAWDAYATDPADLVDRMSVRAIGRKLPSATRSDVVKAVAAFTSVHGSQWKRERVKQAAYLIFASPDFQVQR